MSRGSTDATKADESAPADALAARRRSVDRAGQTGTVGWMRPSVNGVVPRFASAIRVASVAADGIDRES